MIIISDSNQLIDNYPWRDQYNTIYKKECESKFRYKIYKKKITQQIIALYYISFSEKDKTPKINFMFITLPTEYLGLKNYKSTIIELSDCEFSILSKEINNGFNNQLIPNLFKSLNYNLEIKLSNLVMFNIDTKEFIKFNNK